MKTVNYDRDIIDAAEKLMCEGCDEMFPPDNMWNFVDENEIEWLCCDKCHEEHRKHHFTCHGCNEILYTPDEITSSVWVGENSNDGIKQSKLFCSHCLDEHGMTQCMICYCVVHYDEDQINGGKWWGEENDYICSDCMKDGRYAQYVSFEEEEEDDPEDEDNSELASKYDRE